MFYKNPVLIRKIQKQLVLLESFMLLDLTPNLKYNRYHQRIVKTKFIQCDDEFKHYLTTFEDGDGHIVAYEYINEHGNRKIIIK